MEPENKAPEEEKDKKDKKSENGAENAQAETDAETPSESTAEATEETTPESEETPAESESEQPESVPETAPDNEEPLEAKCQRLEAENAVLRAREEARNVGFKNEYVEDAVLIADNAAKRDGITITEALQAVAKKYPEWKHTSDDKGKSGFKVGAEAPKENTTAEDDCLNEAFGLRKKK